MTQSGGLPKIVQEAAVEAERQVREAGEEAQCYQLRQGRLLSCIIINSISIGTLSHALLLHTKCSTCRVPVHITPTGLPVLWLVYPSSCCIVHL